MHKISSRNFHTIMQSYHRPQNNHKIIISISDFVVTEPLFRLGAKSGYYTTSIQPNTISKCLFHSLKLVLLSLGIEFILADIVAGEDELAE